jgi:hypothetical protein
MFSELWVSKSMSNADKVRAGQLASDILRAAARLERRVILAKFNLEDHFLGSSLKLCRALAVAERWERQSGLKAPAIRQATKMAHSVIAWGHRKIQG